jgi:hypothetical protein
MCTCQYTLSKFCHGQRIIEGEGSIETMLSALLWQTKSKRKEKKYASSERPLFA